MIIEIAILGVGTVLAYLLGSISSAVLVCRLMRLPDPRQAGSHNPGTTNVLRIGGKLAAALTLVGDVLKGWIPVYIYKAVWWALVGTLNPIGITLVLLAAILGHLYPVFFGFKGGKGVATFIGGLMGASITLGGFFVLVWCGVFALCRYSSVAAITATVATPIWAYFTMAYAYVPGLSILAAIVLWRHRENLKRLVKGEEVKSTFFNR